jgi:primosomal protein N' (replication factor Y) (superfamily II helicase)
VSTGRVVSVALPLPFQSAFSYRVPDEMPLPERGVRVQVPFGARRVIGVVTGSGAEVDGVVLKDVVEVVDESPLVPPPLLDLAQWVSEHYLAPPGECFRLVMPPSGVRASRAIARLSGDAGASDDAVIEALRKGPLPLSTLARRLKKDPTSHLARLRREGRVRIDQDLRAAGFRLTQVAALTGTTVEPRGAAQRALLERLREAGGRAAVADLVRDRPSLRSAIPRLEGAGALVVTEEREVRGPDVMDGAAKRALTPSGDQAEALEPLLAALDAGGFAPFLLHGVTGSGKTEVYFRVIERVLAAGRGAILLVPEIVLTPLLVRAAAARFGPTVSVIHSELSAGERHDQWWRIREGESRVVVGARSALFAPLVDLGAVIVDEEHEGAYKQEESPRYHARDVAVMRARLEGAVALLGSATPSVESHSNALSGKYQRLSLASRIGSQGLPRIEIVDRRAALKAGSDPILTPPLRAALEDRLARREQSLLLLNRRGYATSLLCRECGQQAACPNCSVSLTVHGAGASIECHYCGYRSRTPTACEACKGEYLRLTGFGTERVAEALQAALPSARIARLDRDVARRRGAVAGILAAFESGQTDILVGTQMIAKGHDFPRVTLVGVVDADVGLGLPDFRNAERTFQLLTQVAGRAGRADLPGEVVLQSHWPDHYALRFACEQDYASFFEREMEFRRTMGYPPAGALVNVVVRSEDAEKGAREAEALARALRRLAPGHFRVLGPARAALARLKQEHRHQILLKGSRAAMREAVRRVLVERYGPMRWPGIMVDVDPVSVM